MSRTFDVVVFGSTGVVGKLVCEHLANHYQGKIKWAMVGDPPALLLHRRNVIGAALLMEGKGLRFFTNKVLIGQVARNKSKMEAVKQEITRKYAAVQVHHHFCA